MFTSQHFKKNWLINYFVYHQTNVLDFLLSVYIPPFYQMIEKLFRRRPELEYDINVFWKTIFELPRAVLERTGLARLQEEIWLILIF